MMKRAKSLGSVMGVVAMLAFVSVGARALAGCSSGASSDTSDGGGSGNGGPGGGGAGGEGGASADAGNDGDPFAACTGVDLSQKGTLDIDLKAVKVSGKVTLNGKALSSTDSASFGRLTLTGASSTAPIGAVTAQIEADGTYHTTVAPGTYDVVYDTNGQCNAQANAWPCGNHVVKSKVTLSADGVLDVDIPSVKASGKVTLAGQAVPPGVTLGYIGFADTDPTQVSGGAAVPVQNGAGSTYAVNLIPGHYKVVYSANGCQPASAVTGPCNGGVLKADANLTSAGVLDLDVPVVSVKGKATLNGSAIPAQAFRGSLTFASTTADAAEKGLGTSTQILADGTYATALFPGTYDVGFASSSPESDPSLMPRNSGVLRPAQALTSSGTLDLDIPSVTVSGKVTLNGSAMPGVANPGHVSFSVSGAAVKGAAGINAAITAGAYKTVLLPGSYDVGYSGDSTPCSQNDMGAPPVVPCNGGTLKTITFAKGQGGVLDLDVKTVKITGKVTLDQGAMPELARISFSPSGAATTGQTGFVVETQSTYSVLLMPGTYDIGYGGGASCSDTMQTMPCNAGTLKESVALTAAGALDIDIPTVTITGKVTLGGKEPPATMDQRGSVTFADKLGGAANTQAFDVSGPMTYSLRILKGRYVVSYDGNAQLCQSGQISPLPCGAQVVAGCP